MDCRTFHKNLEDYLEDSLDFAGRFGMERHAQQCIGCGKDMADAQRIRGMVSELERVKAPESFEASIINEIAKRKLNARTAGIRRFWIYGHEGPPWRKLALASSSLAILAVGVFVFFNLNAARQNSTSPIAMEKPEKPYVNVDLTPDTSRSEPAPSMEKSRSGEIPEVAETAKEPRVTERKFVPEWGAAEAEYVEQLIEGVDGRPVTITLPMPRKIYLQYNQMPEEYFIQNISH
jgi:hypothetical protein